MSSAFSKEAKDAVKATKTFVFLILVFGCIAYIFSGTVAIKTNESGVLLRFGRVINKQLSPGMHFVLPWPVDSVVKVPINEVRTLDIALFYPDDKNPLPASEEPHLMSGDKNLIQIKLSVQVTITDPSSYLFSSVSSDTVASDILSSVLVETCANTKVDELLTIGRVALGEAVSKKGQKMFDELNLGLHIRGIEVKDITPPRSVLPNFKEVVNAQMQKNTKRHNAESTCSSMLFRAKSEARKKVEEANGEYQQKVSRALGESESFVSVYGEYKKNPELFRRKMHLETISHILPSLREVIIVDGKSDEESPIVKIAISE